MLEGKLDTMSAAFGALQADIRNVLFGQKNDREAAAEYRGEMREEVHKIGARVGIIEHRVDEITPVVQDLKSTLSKKEAVAEYQKWLIRAVWGAGAGILSAAGTAAVAYWQARGRLP